MEDGWSRSKAYRMRKEYLDARGLCHVCGHDLKAPGRSLCPACMKKIHEKNMARYVRFKEAGLCTKCGRKNVDGVSRCPECRARERVYQKRCRIMQALRPPKKNP